jgi:NAD(P)-binding Rossmann-like domain
MHMHDKFMRMLDNPSHILVIGGGIGGLCLAHGLRRAGVSVAVYERTHTRTDWLQGYRIHISPHGAAALHACLPPAQWEAFVATAGKPSAGFAFLTEQLRDLLFLPRGLLAGEEASPQDSHHSVSRITLRHVLLDGLDDVVHLGKEFTRYEQAPGGRVTAFFADGTQAGCRSLMRPGPGCRDACPAASTTSRPPVTASSSPPSGKETSNGWPSTTRPGPQGCCSTTPRTTCSGPTPPNEPPTPPSPPVTAPTSAT